MLLVCRDHSFVARSRDYLYAISTFIGWCQRKVSPRDGACLENAIWIETASTFLRNILAANFIYARPYFMFSKTDLLQPFS